MFAVMFFFDLLSWAIGRPLIPSVMVDAYETAGFAPAFISIDGTSTNYLDSILMSALSSSLSELKGSFLFNYNIKGNLVP